MKPRILVIRGGALGDFILTLPAIRLLREAFPAAHLEIIGYRHIAALAEGRFYADGVRSIEFGPLAGFFARSGTLDEDLCAYFAGFQQVVSYLFDPDGIFEANLRRAGVKHFLSAYVRMDDSQHAAQQLAQPLQALALYLEDAGATIYPTETDQAAAAAFLAGQTAPFRVLHPGSGSPRKNWPLARWRDLINALLARGENLLLVGGEADQATLETLESIFQGRVRVARDLPLPHLAAILARAGGFLGHDSGISHLAAAVGTPSVLLFGPTDPVVWAPANPQVRVLIAPGSNLSALSSAEVLAALPPL